MILFGFSGLSRKFALARTTGLVVGLLAGTVFFGQAVLRHYPLEQWLFWSYLGYWGLALVFNVACFSSGYATLKWLVPRGLTFRVRVLQSMALGVLIFFLGAFFIGLAQGYGVVYFVVYPVILFAAGMRTTWRDLRRAVPLWLRARRLRFRRWSMLELLIFAAGVLAIGLIYLVVMVPENTAYDAKWYHLPIAEHYAALGGIEPFVEGWFQGALPHLSSFLYTWAMLMPVGLLVDRVMVCAHLEFSLYLWVLFSIPLLVRRLIPTARPHLAWVATFLFPGIFLYDANLNTTADHIAAFWAIPIFLALQNAWKALDVRHCGVLGALLAAALLTKYQAASLVVFPVLAVVARWVWLTRKAPRGERLRPFLGAATAGVVMIVIFAPHWLKNWVWYGDPAYPWLHKYFHAKLWTPDNLTRLEAIYEDHLWQPRGTTLQKLATTFRALWTFSIEPNDWPALHRDWPVFGSLFTMLVFALPFLRASRRVWALFVSANVGVFTWYWMSHQDRYLQALVPWFAAFTAAAIILAWRSGNLARGALGLLLGLQIVWGGDVPFIGTHRQIGQSPIKVAVDRLASGFNRNLAMRVSAWRPLVNVGDALPKGSKALIHEEEPHLGLQTMSVSDWSDWQGGLSYGRMRSPAEVHDRFVQYGVTHIVMAAGRSRDRDALPGDVVYFDYITHFAKPWKNFDYWAVYTLSPTRPPDTPYRKILWVGCDFLYERGLYSFDKMMTPFWGHRQKSDVPPPDERVDWKDPAALDAALEQADAVGLDPNCQKIRPPSLGRFFNRVTMRGPLEVWLRKR